MRSVFVPADFTAPLSMLRDDVVIALAAGVTLTLPAPVGDCRLRVKALGAGCEVISAAGIETTGMTTSTSAVAIAIGEVKSLVSYHRADDGSQTAYLNAST